MNDIPEGVSIMYSPDYTPRKMTPRKLPPKRNLDKISLEDFRRLKNNLLPYFKKKT